MTPDRKTTRRRPRPTSQPATDADGESMTLTPATLGKIRATLEDPIARLIAAAAVVVSLWLTAQDTAHDVRAIEPKVDAIEVRQDMQADEINQNARSIVQLKTQLARVGDDFSEAIQAAVQRGIRIGVKRALARLD